MMTKIWTVDSFTNQPYKGNPAGVMIVKDFPEDSICQIIAAEMNLSETAFIKPLQENHFHLRWFTPTTEVKLCGHATLAAAHILFEQKLVKDKIIEFDSLSGKLFVCREEDALSMDFPLQETGPDLDPKSFEETLSLPSGSILNAVQAYDDVILEMKSPKMLKELTLDTALVMKIDCRGLIITAKSNMPYDFISRFFAPRVGVPEDPVTGSAHCKLAHYWSKKLGKQNFFAYQASRRGGEISIQVSGDRVSLKGQAVTILEGEWKV